MRVAELRAWVASDDPPWRVTELEVRPGTDDWTHELWFTTAFMRLPFARAVLDGIGLNVVLSLADRTPHGVRGWDIRGLAPDRLVLRSASPTAELAPRITSEILRSFIEHQAGLVNLPPAGLSPDGIPLHRGHTLVDFDALDEAGARRMMQRYLDRHDDRRAWLDRRVGTTLTADARGLRTLVDWWIAWRGTDARLTDPGVLPEWHPGVVPDPDGHLTAAEVELVDAASFLVADVAMTRDPTLRWSFDIRPSSVHHHEPILESPRSGELAPRHQLRVFASGLGRTTDGLGDPLMGGPTFESLERLIRQVVRTLPRAPDDGPFDVTLDHDGGLAVWIDRDAEAGLSTLAAALATLPAVAATSVLHDGRGVRVTVADGTDAAEVAATIRATLRSDADIHLVAGTDLAARERMRNAPQGPTARWWHGTGDRPWLIARRDPRGRWTHEVTYDEELLDELDDPDALDRLVVRLPSSLPSRRSSARTARCCSCAPTPPTTSSA